ncbi:MAG: ATP synthase F0 subunit B [Candidatus Gastranaerophilales bacterium]|nr:ATP synthase F0 subunit B [Candidatus Gastranaerophilales bacterium]
MEFNATFIVAFVSFIIFIIIMNYILYKPINEIVEKRKSIIDENYSNAKKNKEKSSAILQDRLDKLQNARSRVKEETTAALDEAKKKRQELEDSAKSEAKLKTQENLNALNHNKQEAIEVLKNDVINLAQIISDKFIDSPDKISDVDNATIQEIMQN